MTNPNLTEVVEGTGARAGDGIPAGFTREAWTQRVLRHALEAIEAGASASIVMNVEGLKDNIRNLLAAAPAVPAPAGMATVSLETLAAWKSMVNTLAVLSLKRERTTVGITLKRLIQDEIDAAAQAPATVAAAGSDA